MSIKRHRIDIERQVSTIDSSRQLVHTYEDRYINEPASYMQVSGGESVRGRQIEAGVNAVFECNYREGYEVTDRILFDGVYYGIVRIDNPGGVKRYTTFYCKAIL